MKSTIFLDERCVAWYKSNDILDERIASIFRIELQAKYTTGNIKVPNRAYEE